MLDPNKDASKKRFSYLKLVVSLEHRDQRMHHAFFFFKSRSICLTREQLLGCDAREEVQEVFPWSERLPAANSASANAKTIVGVEVQW